MEKITFIEPKTPGDNIFNKSMALPLMGPLYLATIAQKAGYDVQIYNENITTVYSEAYDTIRKDVLDSDYLIISSLTSTAQRGYRIAKAFKRDNPHGKVIIGGIHATFKPSEAMQYADTVAIGEGEEIFFEALKTNKRVIQGRPLSDMDTLPTPNFSLIKDFKPKTAPIMTSRGCPYDCNFCSVTQMFGRGYRFRNTDLVIKDLEAIKQKNVFFYDDHFMANKNRTKELLSKMKENGINKRWDAQMRVEIGNDEALLKQMSDTGCDIAYIGLESVNEKTLKSYRKSQNVNYIRNTIKKLHDYGIKLHGMFVLGSDYDNKNTIKQTLEFSEANDLDTVQYAILTPLPGTEVYNNLNNQKRIITKDWDYYDGLHTVFNPKQMSAYELQTRMIDAMKSFYSASKGYKLIAKKSAEATLTMVRNWFYEKKKRVPEMKNAAYKIVGNKIINRWEKTNKSYLQFLNKHKTNQQVKFQNCA